MDWLFNKSGMWDRIRMTRMYFTTTNTLLTGKFKIKGTLFEKVKASLVMMNKNIKTCQIIDDIFASQPQSDAGRIMWKDARASLKIEPISHRAFGTVPKY